MTKAWIVAALSVVLGVYAGLHAAQYVSILYVDGIIAKFVPRLVEMITGVVGGLLLFRGSWMGYLMVSVAWATAFALGIPEFSKPLEAGIFMPMDFLVSIPVLVILYRAIREKRHREST